MALPRRALGKKPELSDRCTNCTPNVANLDNLLRPKPLASPAAAANRLSRDVDNDRAARVPDDRVERWLVEVKINDVDISSIPCCD